MKFLTGIIITIFLMTSCDRPKCSNVNPVFENYLPQSNEYKRELAHLIKQVDSDQLRYWFHATIAEKPVELYDIYVQGEGICAKIILENRSKHIGLGKGGFRGAELVDISFSVEERSGQINFVLEDIGDIID